MKSWVLLVGWLLWPGLLAAADVPAKVLDLSHWKLTVPMSSNGLGPAAEIKQPQLALFQDRHVFFVDPRAKAVIFRAPCGGVTTKGSKYPRSELREMSGSNPESPADWATTDSEIHTLTVIEAVTHLPDHKPHVCCAQIHDAKSDLIEVRVERGKLFVQRDKASDAELDANYQLGTFFELKIVAGQGHVQAFYNGVPKMDWEVSRKGCYFKAGCYTQSNVEKGDAAEAYGEVAIRKLSVTIGR
jgi:hypothetical protein